MAIGLVITYAVTHWLWLVVHQACVDQHRCDPAPTLWLRQAVCSCLSGASSSEQIVDSKRQRLHVTIADGDGVCECGGWECGNSSRHGMALAA
jgi:hypothetical protein